MNTKVEKTTISDHERERLEREVSDDGGAE